MIHSLRLASFRYMSRTREDRKCFSSVLACVREDLRLSPATRALSSSLSIFILPWSRVSQASMVRRGPSVVSHNSSYDTQRKCPGRFRITLKSFHSRDRESAISMLTRALSITLLGTRPLSNHPCWPFQLLLSLGLISLFCIIEDGRFVYFTSLSS